ncbi:cytochrome P450 [Streptomyces sp. NPDC005438]|uniref:cytochrome P450 family protein n=1 Tax=Streptomyces sp. NPDC005438 TaxID=3156880 RepID=UPI0033AB2391
MSASLDARSLNPFTALLGEERHTRYRKLRELGPVVPLTTPTGASAWFVTDHEQVRALLTNGALSKGGWEAAPFGDRLPEDVARGTHTTMLNSDPPAHTRLRKLVTRAFTRRPTERLRPRIQQFTDELLDAAAREAGPVDLVSALAYPLPVTVICEMLGIPEEERGDFRVWTERLVSPGAHGFDEYSRALTSLHRYSLTLIEEKRRAPRQDLLSDLIAVRDHQEGLSEDELTSMIFLLLLAGHETTTNLIGNGVRALLTHPEQLQTLRDHPDRWEGAIEELLRYEGPLQNTLGYRTTQPVQIGDVTVPADAVVYLSLLSANRDGQRFPEPDSLDVTRDSRSHIAFGHGIHYCLGAPLARLEAHVVFRTLVDRYPGLRLAVPPQEVEWRPSTVMHGLTELPVYLN